MKRALIFLLSLAAFALRRVRARGASRLSRTAPDRRRRRTTCCGRCRAAERTCASGSTWSFRRAARTSPSRAASMVNNAFTERWTVQCAGGLTGGTIHIAGLSATMTDVLVRLERLDGTTQVTRLTPSAPSFVVEAAPGALEVARTYLVLGVEHILGGIDHLAVRARAVDSGERHAPAHLRPSRRSPSRTASRSRRRRSASCMCQAPPVEAAIALSIVFVAAEIVHSRQGEAGLTERFPWVVAFTFGLLHGFGFAGALSEVGLPQRRFPSRCSSSTSASRSDNCSSSRPSLLSLLSRGKISRRIAMSLSVMGMAHSSVCHRRYCCVLARPAHRRFLD